MLAYFILKIEAYDAEAFVAEIKRIDANGVIILINYAGEMRVVHKPERIPLAPVYRHFRKGHWSSSRWFKWFIFIGQYIRILTTVLWREHVGIVILEGGDVASWITECARLFGRVDRTADIIADWSYIKRGDLLNGLKIYLNDIILGVFGTPIILTTAAVYEERRKFWGGWFNKNVRLVDNYWARLLQMKRSTAPRGKKILFLGNLRANFAIEALFELLPRLNKEYGFRLKVVGPETEMYHHYHTLSEEMNVGAYIDWRGFVPLEKFTEEFADCFCGVNLQELQENNSQYAVAGRVVNYLQYLVVPIMSPSSGVMVQVLRDHQLGPVCEVRPDQLYAAIVDAFDHHEQYIAKIKGFLSHNPYHKPFEEIISLAKT